jgi:cell division protein FtsQ
MLENNIWIENAEIYFDNRDILHVTVTEKEPVARIFATDGNSFYIDSLGRILPLSDKQSARVPLFTNFPGKKILSAKDSLLLDDIRGIANFIIRDSFWTSQAAQININSEKKFEMIPLIGNHIVKLGNGEDIVQKFRRLMIFYRQILSKTGFNKYKVIDVQYNGQVVATNFSGDTKIDSALLRKNVERLLQKTKEEPNDSLRRMMQVSIQKKTGADSAFSHATELPLMNEMNPGKKTNPENGKSDSLASAAVRNDGRHIGNTHLVNKENKPIQMGKKKPKAVMPKKPAEDANGGYN